MLLTERFEDATDLILEGIDTGDIALIVEGSKRFKEAVETYKALLELTKKQFAGVMPLDKTLNDKFLKDIEKGIQDVASGSSEDGFEVTTKWSNLLKLKSPWSAGQSNMTELSMFAAKLDILSRGMIECIGEIATFCEGYKGVFVINTEGISISPDSQVNPDLSLADIAGVVGEDLLKALIPGTPSEPSGDSSEEENEEGDKDPKESIRFNNDLLLSELFGLGRNDASNDELAMVYENFPNLCGEIDGDKLKQAKEVYKYFQGLADGAKDLAENMADMLVKLEPTAALQNSVKRSDSSWLESLFKTPKYKITKEEAEILVGKEGILGVPFSKFKTLVKQLQDAMKKEAPAEAVKKTAEDGKEQEEKAAEKVDGNKELKKAEEVAAETASTVTDQTDATVSTEDVIEVAHELEGEVNDTETVTATVEEELGLSGEEAEDVAEVIVDNEDDIEDAGGSAKASKPFKAKKIDKNSLKALFDDDFGKGEGAPFNSTQKNILNFALRGMELVTEVYNYGNSEEDVIADLVDTVKKLKPEDCGVSGKNVKKWKKNQKSLVDKLQDKDKIDSMASFIQKELDYPFGEIPEDAEGEASPEATDSTGSTESEEDSGANENENEKRSPYDVLVDIEALDDDTKEEWIETAEEEGVVDDNGDAVKGTTKDQASDMVGMIEDDISDAEEEELEDSMVIDESFARWQRLAGILKD